MEYLSRTCPKQPLGPGTQDDATQNG
jgi:hypothetical protein